MSQIEHLFQQRRRECPVAKLTKKKENALLNEFFELALLSALTVGIIIAALYISLFFKLRVEALHWLCSLHVHLERRPRGVRGQELDRLLDELHTIAVRKAD